MIFDFCIAAACIIGPTLFFTIGWHLGRFCQRAANRAALRTREHSPFTVSEQRPSDPWDEVNKMRNRLN